MNSRNFGFAAGGFLLGLAAASPFILQPPAPSSETAGNSSPISLSEHPAFWVYLAGQVHQEGVVRIRPGEKVTVSQAIILDGGLTAFSDQDRVSLIRKRSNGTSLITKVNLKLAEDGRGIDPLVQRDDLINVPQRLINF